MSDIYDCEHEPRHMEHGHMFDPVTNEELDEVEDFFDCDPECAVEGFEYPVRTPR